MVPNAMGFQLGGWGGPRSQDQQGPLGLSFIATAVNANIRTLYVWITTILTYTECIKKMKPTRNSIMKYVVQSAALSVFLSSASAANWVGLGDTGLYFDTDSVKREGDLASILFTDDSRKDMWGMHFDCKRRLLIRPQQWAGSIDDNGYRKKAFKLACERWWEVWK